MEFNNINTGSTTWGQAAAAINENFGKASSELEKLKSATIKNKGYFVSLSSLQNSVSYPVLGDYAYVGFSYPFTIYRYNGSRWESTSATGGSTTFEPVNDIEYEDLF